MTNYERIKAMSVDKKLTDEEIIKRLERCVKRDNRNYDTDIVLDLINRQKAEIEKLKGSTIIIKREAKAEAYKEFAKEVTDEISKAYNNNSGVLREHLEKHKEKPDFEFVSAIQGEMNILLGLDDFIDDILKEKEEGIYEDL